MATMLPITRHAARITSRRTISSSSARSTRHRRLTARSGCGRGGRAAALACGDALQPLLCGLCFGSTRSECHDLLPRLLRAIEIALAERQHDALVEERLRVLRI